MVDGLAPHIAYYPVAALAALTAALVTLIVAVNAWRRSSRVDESHCSNPGNKRDHLGNFPGPFSAGETESSKKGNSSKNSIFFDSICNIVGDVASTEEPYLGREAVWSDDGCIRRSPWHGSSAKNPELIAYSVQTAESEILNAYINKLQNQRESGWSNLMVNSTLDGLCQTARYARKYRSTDEYLNSACSDYEEYDRLENSKLFSRQLSHFKTDASRQSPYITHHGSLGRIAARTRKAKNNSRILRCSRSERNSPILDMMIRSRNNIENLQPVGTDVVKFTDFSNRNVRNIINYGEDCKSSVEDDVIKLEVEGGKDSPSVDVDNSIENQEFQSTEARKCNDIENNFVSRRNSLKENVFNASDLSVNSIVESGLGTEESGNLKGVFLNGKMTNSPQSSPRNREMKKNNYRLVSSRERPQSATDLRSPIMEHEPMDSEETPRSLYSGNGLFHSLDSVFFLYDTTKEEANRPKSFIHDEQLRLKFDIDTIKKSIFDKTDATAEGEAKRRSSYTQDSRTLIEQDIKFKYLVPVRFEPVSFNNQNLDRVMEKNADDFSAQEGGISNFSDDPLSACPANGKKAESSADVIDASGEGESLPEQFLESKGWGKSSCESRAMRPNSFPPEEGGRGEEAFLGRTREIQRREIISRRVSGEDNGVVRQEELHSCSMSSDVTSSDPRAVHRGKPPSVQGSHREEKIGKACSQSGNVTQTRNPSFSDSPAYDGRKMQMADGNASSWTGHDSDTERAISEPNADRLGRLDVLVNHLRELAGVHALSDRDSFPNRAATSDAPLGSHDDALESEDYASVIRRVSVGLLSEYYHDGHRFKGKRESLPSDSDFILSELSASESSNYASDDSQSLGLSSISGDSNRSYSSCIDSSSDSPKPVRYQVPFRRYSADVTNLPKLVETSADVTPEALEDAFDRDATKRSDDFVFYKPVDENIKCDVKSLSDSDELNCTSSPNSDDAVGESQSDPNEAAMDDSPGQVRLRQLLQRDVERQERQKLRFERLLADGQAQPSVENKDGTLQAMEEAICHMHRIIQKEKNKKEQCHGDDLDQQYVHALRTMDLRNDAEVQKFKLISFDSSLDKMSKNSSDSGIELLGNKRIGNEPDENLIACDSRAGGGMEFIDHLKPDFSEDELLIRCESDRWRNHAVPGLQEIADDIKSKIDESTECKFSSINETTLEKPRDSREWLYGDAMKPLNSSVEKQEPPYNLSTEKSKFATREADCRWRRRAESDVTTGIRQSASTCVRGEGADRGAVASGSPFSDALRYKQVPKMESGGCEMEKVASSPPPPAPMANAATNTTPTPTKVKNLRFKLDPDIFDLPSENGYYPEDDDDYNRRPGWKKQSKYQAFSSLELGRNREPVKVVSVRTSVVPAGTKMVVKPVCVSEGQISGRGQESDDSKVTVKHLDIDLRIRLETQERDGKSGRKIEPIIDVVRGDWRASPDRQPKRSYLSSSPSETKKRSPLPEYTGWNQSLSPVSENCDWVAVPSNSSEDIHLSTSSDPGPQNKVFVSRESSYDEDSKMNPFETDAIPFKVNGSDQLGDSLQNLETPNESCTTGEGSSQFTDAFMTSTPARPSTLELSHFRKHLQIPRKKFVPDPTAVERITGFKAAEEKSSTKPPLPPSIRALPNSHRLNSGAKNRIDQLRKKYLDSKSMLAAQKSDSSAKFEQFLNRAQEERAKIATSTPDLAAFEAAVRSQWSKARSESDGNSASKENSPPLDMPGGSISARSATPDDVWVNYVQMLRRQLNRRSQSMSYLETDVDAFFAEDKCQSMTTLEKSPPNSTQSLLIPTTKSKRISVNLEESGRTKSAHELRIEKSLQNLTVPEWYKHSQRPKTGFILDKKPSEKRGWAAVKSLASSTTSLTSVGTKPRRPARSLRTSQENLMWSRGSASPASADNSYARHTKSTNGPVLSLALAKAFREPYVGWRARTPSSCASASPQVDFSPPSWVVMDNTDRSDTPLTSDLQAMDEEEDTGISFDGEDVLEEPGSSDVMDPAKLNNPDSPLPSADDTCDDIINISMDTCDHVSGHHEDSKSGDLPGEDTCDDIKNITMDTCELFPPNPNEEPKASPIGDDTCDEILNISTDTSSHLHPALNGNQGTSSVMGATEDTGVDIDDISTDTSNIVLSQPITNGNREALSVDDNRISNGSPECNSSLLHITNNLNESIQSNHSVDEKLPPPSHIINDNGIAPSDDHGVTNGNHDGFRKTNGEYHHIIGNGNTISLHLVDRHSELEEKRLDPKRKRYSYNRSIYQSELEEVKNRTAIQNRSVLDGSTQSLPGDKHSRDINKVIWIESSFVGSRTTTSIVVLPTDDTSKNTSKGSTGSNTSVGRPASR